MKQKFIEWFAKGNNGVPPAVNAAGEFEHEKTQHMWEAYQGGVAEQAQQVRLLTEQRDAVVAENVGLKMLASEAERAAAGITLVVGGE